MANFQVVDGREVLASGAEFVYVAGAVLACRDEGRLVRVLYSDGVVSAVELSRMEVEEHLESVADQLRDLVEAL